MLFRSGLGLLFVLTTLFLPKGLLGLALRDPRARPAPKPEISPIAIEEGVEP